MKEAIKVNNFKKNDDFLVLKRFFTTERNLNVGLNITLHECKKERSLQKKLKTNKIIKPKDN
jgi:hypothetical protein